MNHLNNRPGTAAENEFESIQGNNSSIFKSIEKNVKSTIITAREIEIDEQDTYSIEVNEEKEEDFEDRFLRMNPGNKIRKKAIGVDLSDF